MGNISYYSCSNCFPPLFINTSTTISLSAFNASSSGVIEGGWPPYFAAALTSEPEAMRSSAVFLYDSLFSFPLEDPPCETKWSGVQLLHLSPPRSAPCSFYLKLYVRFNNLIYLQVINLRFNKHILVSKVFKLKGIAVSMNFILFPANVTRN